MNASALFDALQRRFELKNDAALCRALGIAPPAISKSRSRNSVSAEMILRIHDTFDMPAKEIRKLGQRA